MSLIYKEEIESWTWYEAESVFSTNDTVKEEISGLGNNIVISAKCQTGGRGRRGKTWQEILGNLYFTYTQVASAQELSKIVCIIGLSLAKVIKALSPQSDVKIKWPNDVFLEGKKMSGILIENIKENLWAIGIGINVEGAPKLEGANYQATSLKENGIALDRTEILRYYLNQYSEDMKEYRRNGFRHIREQWLKIAKNYHQEITVKTEKETKEGIFEDLDDNGYLILKTQQGEERIIAGDLFV